MRLLRLIFYITCFSLLLNALFLSLWWLCLADIGDDLGPGNPRVDRLIDMQAHDEGRLAGRMLGSTRSLANSSNAATTHGSSGSAQHGHPQDALIFLFNAIIFGVVLLQLSTFPRLHHMQQTVALFVLGILYSLVQEGLKFNKHLGILGKSYDMWMHIDPHLMLFTMLPALLAGDAMALDTNVVKRVAGQCMYLAGPGVLINMILAASFLKFYLSYDWQFELCLTAGAILAATDPVAVVGLLKQLGAAPSLTILIQGESLLNDGTAIVCFVLSYDMLQGASYDFGGVVVFILRKAICACGLGWVIGWVFVVWISAAGNRFEHNSSMIQVCLTICCAYWSFIIAEGVLDMSGVLCTVSASLVLADNMWASIVDKEVLLHVWHVIEFLGNTLIFFLAGALTGNCMVYIPAEDYLHLLVIYIMLTLIRGTVILGSLPILRKLGNATLPISEALVMTWGGLRGAVGLALAIQVSIEKAGGKIGDMDSRRVLFYTGGVAFLTLAVNAVTSPSLIKFLGLVQTDDVKRKLLLKVCSQMVKRVKIESLKPTVRRAVEEMIAKIDETVAATYSVECGQLNNAVYNSEATATPHAPKSESEFSLGNRELIGCSQLSMRNSIVSNAELDPSLRSASKFKSKIRTALAVPQVALNEGQMMYEDFGKSWRKIETIPESIFGLLNVPSGDDLQLSSGIGAILNEKKPDPEVMELINVALLSLVQAEYWHMIEEGEFIQGSSHPGLLLNSVTWAMQAKAPRLGDYDFLFKELELQKRDQSVAVEEPNASTHVDGPNAKWASPHETAHQVMEMSAIIADAHTELKGTSRLNRLITSAQFNMFITSVIVLNVINVFIEEGNMKGKSGSEYAAWLAIEVCFTVIFCMEFILKFTALGRHYFMDAWNFFDFLLVVSGIVGIIVELIWDEDDAAVSSQARAFRVNRLFRVMRLLRVFRLVQLLGVLRAKWSGLELSLHLAKNMRTVTILTAFARAHWKAEKSLVKFFGNPLRFPGSEMARCIVDSRSAVCEAVCAAAFQIGKLEIVILERLAALRESGKITEDLSQFILEAGKMGTMNAKEAENLLQPLREQQQLWFNEEKHHLAGIYDRDKTALLVNCSSFGVQDGSEDAVNRRGSLRTAMKFVQHPFERIRRKSIAPLGQRSSKQSLQVDPLRRNSQQSLRGDPLRIAGSTVEKPP